ncbi:uncharacterized protein LOC119085482 [Bradysia coprophila]|uniref:uncharacterized protein LOC119085482 n=1 Tax=Bradysia coprophila TaxID=38358 RepID=UPI00187D9C99|nr:uncharacterized protein LOC119085482 [Bradysia coprophila]
MSPPQTRKRSRPDNADLLEKNPVTVAEKLILQEQNFQKLAAEFHDMKTEQQLYKVQILICQQEISEWKKTSEELRAEISKLKIDHQLHADQWIQAQREFSEWQKESVDRAVVQSKLVGTRANETAGGVIDERLQMRAIYNNLPCKGIDEYERLKIDLANINFFVYMEKRLGSIGGVDVRSCIVAILNRLMCPDVQGKFSLTGKRTTKPGVTDTIIIELVHCAVRITHPTYKDKDGETIIGKIFTNK